MNRSNLAWILAAVVGAMGIGFSTPAVAAPDLVVKWAQEASAGKLSFDGKIALPDKAKKGSAAQIEIHRTGEAEGSEALDIELKKNAKKLKYVVKGVAAGTYLVHVRVDMDGDGAYGAGDLDGWYAGKNGEVVQTRDAAVAIEISKKKTKNLDFGLGPIEAAAAEGGEAAEGAGSEDDGAGGDAAAAEGGAAAEGAVAAPAAGGAAPAGRPAWVAAGSGPKTEGEKRSFVGVNFKQGSDDGDAKRRAQAALENVVENFSLLATGKYRSDAKAQKKEVDEAQVQAITEALLAATKVADGSESWNAGGAYFAALKVDLAAAIERVKKGAGVSDDFKAWFAANAVQMHTLFSQLEG